jgi:hypothetical protein
MEGEYSQEWAELRRLRQRVLTIVLAGAAVFVLVPLIQVWIPQRRQGNRASAVFSLGGAAVQVFLRLWRVCLLVMPQMR